MKRKFFLIQSLSFLLLCNINNFAQAPTMANSANFAMFTTTGAFENVDASVIKGDIGTNVGALNGFPPGTVDGEIHVANSTTAQAVIDLEAAYNELTAKTCETAIGALLGNGQTLIPSTYCTGMASSLSGTLTLDGEGDSDALFIIKIDGAFSTSNLSNVVLINSASSCNVFWLVDGAIELGEYSTFKGSLVVNGAISMLVGAELVGQGLTKAGAITMNDNSITKCDWVSSVLGVSLISFTAIERPNNNLIELNWQTGSETNSDYFSVEKYSMGTDFISIGRVEAKGNSNQTVHYSLDDTYPTEGITYYRLNQFDLNGENEYSKEITVNSEEMFHNVGFFPNPFTNKLQLNLNPEWCKNKCELSIYDTFGKVVLSLQITESITTVETAVLLSGIYYYKLTSNNALLKSGKLISKQ